MVYLKIKLISNVVSWRKRFYQMDNHWNCNGNSFLMILGNFELLSRLSWIYGKWIALNACITNERFQQKRLMITFIRMYYWQNSNKFYSTKMEIPLTEIFLYIVIKWVKLLMKLTYSFISLFDALNYSLSQEIIKDRIT